MKPSCHYVMSDGQKYGIFAVSMIILCEYRQKNRTVGRKQLYIFIEISLVDPFGNFFGNSYIVNFYFGNSAEIRSGNIFDFFMFFGIFSGNYFNNA